jgi:hypothetical protein
MSALASRYRPASAAPESGAAFTARLVDGLCHDCRTPLAIIGEFASIVGEDLGASAPSETLDFLWSIGERVREIEGLLADFALVDRLLRKPPEAVDPVDVGVTLTEMQAGIGPLARAFGKTLSWTGLAAGLMAPIRGGELLRAVSMLVDNFYRISGNRICIRVWRAGAGEVGGAIVIECIVGDIEADEAAWSAAGADQMSFRHQLVSAIAAHYGGRLDLLDGAEHRACRLVLPAAEPARTQRVDPAA